MIDPNIASTMGASDIELPADVFFATLTNHLRQMEDSLKEDEAVALIHAQSNEAIYIRQVSKRDGNIIVLDGIDVHGHRTSVLAHMASLQVIFKVVPKAGVERKPIGFRVETAGQSAKK